MLAISPRKRLTARSAAAETFGKTRDEVRGRGAAEGSRPSGRGSIGTPSGLKRERVRPFSVRRAPPYRTLSRMGRELKQGEIGVVIDGKYYGITEYQAE